MRLSIKIWLFAILYQTIILICALSKYSWSGKAIFSLIPVEFIGGLPGLFLLIPIVNYLVK